MLKHDVIRTAMAFGPSLVFIIVFPPLMAIAVSAGKRREAARKKRIEAYRASPESHVLRL